MSPCGDSLSHTFMSLLGLFTSVSLALGWDSNLSSLPIDIAEGVMANQWPATGATVTQ